MPPVKAKVPEYPRPVSPVCAAEYPICDDNTVYIDEDSGVEENTEQRAAKRRRIESYATAYLRGEPLFILSAQLKGPFGKGWRNPWRRRRKPDNNNEISRLEVPETTFKPGLPPAAHSSASSTSLRPQGDLPPRYPRKLSQRNIVTQSDIVKITLPVEPLATVPAPDEEASNSQNQRVEDWLKTNDDYSQSEDEHPRSPSSPSIRPANTRTKKWKSPIINIGIPPVPDSVVNLRNLLPSHGTSTLAVGKSPQPLEKVDTDLNTTVISELAAFNAASSTRFEQGYDKPTTAVDQSKDPSANKSRAEYAISDSKRRSLHTVPPSSHLPAFEYRRVSNEKSVETAQEPDDADTNTRTNVAQTTEMIVHLPPGSTGGFDSLHTARDAMSVAPDAAMPPLSKELSKASTTIDLPSAQIPVQPILHSVHSNLSSNGHMLEEPVAQAAAPMGISTNRNVPLSTTGAPVINKVSDDMDKVILDRRLFATGVPMEALISPYSDTTPKVGAVRPLNTQEIIESITPFAFTTTKKKTTATENKTTQKAATKSRTIQKRKRTSFIAEEVSSGGSSQGSLTAIMKVAKTVMINQGKSSSFKGIDAWDGGADENSNHHIPSKLSSLLFEDGSEKKTAPKSILKSSLIASTGGPISPTNIASSSTKQDAQKVRGLDMVDIEAEAEEDDFDVDAAIDDLGSFLGTWDADKEALELGKGLG